MDRRETFINDSIPRCREVALELLRPSARDLEHGLEIHKESLVMESYGLGLRAPCDPKMLEAAIDEGATSGEVHDLHLDTTLTGWARNSELAKEFKEAWEASGVTCICLNAGEEGNQPLRLIRRLAHHTYIIGAMGGFMQRISEPGDILIAKRHGQRAYCLTLNGVPLAGLGRAVEEELSLIRIFAQLGIRMMHLTYNRRNLLGDGCMEHKDAGLSDFGRAAVAEMNRCGVMIDLAHTGWQTCLDTAKTSRFPVVISHSAAFALNEHPRAKPDNVIRAALDTGGTMGIAAVPAFLGGSGDVTSLLDHIDYLVKKFGADAVTIGTDRAHLSRDSAQASAMVSFGKRRQPFEVFWGGEKALKAAEWNRPCQWESMAWTNWPLFTVGLVQRGHSDEAIRKIIGGNILRVATQVWQGSDLAASPSKDEPS